MELIVQSSEIVFLKIVGGLSHDFPQKRMIDEQTKFTFTQFLQKFTSLSAASGYHTETY